MIKKFQNNKGTMVNFGKGTVRIKTHILQSRFGAQVEFVTCEKTELGKVPSKVDLLNKVVLDFSTLESLDLLIEKLTEARDLLSEVKDEELPEELRKLAIEFAKEETNMERPHKSQAPIIKGFEGCYKIMKEKGLIKKESI